MLRYLYIFIFIYEIWSTRLLLDFFSRAVWSTSIYKQKHFVFFKRWKVNFVHTTTPIVFALRVDDQEWKPILDIRKSFWRKFSWKLSGESFLDCGVGATKAFPFWLAEKRFKACFARGKKYLVAIHLFLSFAIQNNCWLKKLKMNNNLLNKSLRNVI